MSELLDKLYLAEQVDLLTLSLINLQDMIKDGEIDLVLQQAKKSVKQKAFFIQKIIEAVESPELRQMLEAELNRDLQNTVKDSGNEHSFDYFREKNLEDVLHSLQGEAEKVGIVRLTVAIEFKEKDLREMAAFLTERLERKTALHVTVDKSLIGGVVVQSGNYISDYTVKTRLDQYRAQWHEAVVHA